MKTEPAQELEITNLTITVNKDVLRKARIRALQEDDSVNAYLRRCLDKYADEDARVEAAVERIQQILDTHVARSGGYTFSREEVYDHCRD